MTLEQSSGYTSIVGECPRLRAHAGKYKALNVQGAQGTLARGINNAGMVTVESTDSAGYFEAWLYDGTKYTAINVPGAAVIEAAGINTAGDIVYFVSDPYGVGHAALKSGKNYYIFDYPKGSNTASRGHQ